MTGLRYSPLHVTELCGEMQGNFKVGCARLIMISRIDSAALMYCEQSLIAKALTDIQQRSRDYTGISEV